MNRNEFNEKLMNCKNANEINNFFKQQNTQQFIESNRSKIGTYLNILNTNEPFYYESLT